MSLLDKQLKKSESPERKKSSQKVRGPGGGGGFA